MPDPVKPWEQSFDQPGSADRRAVRLGTTLSVLIILVALGVALFGRIPLPACPQFALLHTGFVFLLNTITFFILLILLAHRRLITYAILAGTFLFEALAMIPFALTFPGMLVGDTAIIGGQQSATWVWMLWHTMFPLLVAFALLADRHFRNRKIAKMRIPIVGVVAALIAVLFAFLVLWIAAGLHDWLPPLLQDDAGPANAAAKAITLISFVLTALPAVYCWQVTRQQRIALHLWLAITLLACLAGTMSSLGAIVRYSLAWYFARIETMLASAMLLMFFLNEINRLHHRLASALSDLMTSNQRLAHLLVEKNRLVANLSESEARNRQLAYYDPLTDLPNRRLLLDRLEQALTHAKRNRNAMAIMFLDLDHFKEINDTLGHDAGDRLLVTIATRMTECLRKGDTASRSGGDEFIVILPEIAFAEDVAIVAEKIINALRQPVAIGPSNVEVTISIGIAIHPIDGQDSLRELLRKADRAMYAAKAHGRDQFCFYDPTPPSPDSPFHLE